MKKYMKYIKLVSSLLIFFLHPLFQVIPILIFNIDLENISAKTNLYLQVFSSALSFIILIIMYRKDIINGIKDLKAKKCKPLLDGFNYWFIGLMIMVLSTTIIGLLSGNGTSSNESQIREMINTSWLTVISVSVLGPVIEELVWRQSLYDVFKNKWIYLLTSGVLFGALHVFGEPITSYVDILYLIPYCSVGVAFAYTQYKTKNIMASITMHVVHNTLNTISVLLFMGLMI